MAYGLLVGFQLPNIAQDIYRVGMKPRNTPTAPWVERTEENGN